MITLVSTFHICVATFSLWNYPTLKPEYELSTVTVKMLESGAISDFESNSYQGQLSYGWVYPIYRGRDVVCE